MNENTAIGTTALLSNYKTPEDRGVMVYYVKVGNIDVPQYRPMTPQELSIRDSARIERERYLRK